MKKIGFLGCGKIGKRLLKEIQEKNLGEVVFIQDPFCQEKKIEGVPVIPEYREELYDQADLFIECATADALKAQTEKILTRADLLMFSVTAFSDAAFEEEVKRLTAANGTRVFIPHGAILGLDGILDGRQIWEEVSIETTKSPASLSRQDTERTVVYEGPTREACREYPRNVNVHAAVALSGIGFEKTRSVVISDPSVHTNAHVIRLKGKGVEMELHVESFTTGGVTGEYTPLSACGSLHRILDEKAVIQVV